MHGKGGMQLHKFQHRRADPADVEINEKLSTGFEPRTGLKSG